MVENTTVENVVAEPSQVQVPVPEPATTEAISTPAPAPAKEELKQSETVPPAPVEPPPNPVAEEGKVSEDVPEPVEQVVPVQAETSAEAPPASAPVEPLSDPAPVEEKPHETPAAPIVPPDVVSGATEPNGTANGNTTASKEQEDIEMKDVPTASPVADAAAAPAPAEPKPDFAAVSQPAGEPEVAAVAGEKRKAADEGPTVDEALIDKKKAKVEEATSPTEVTSAAADPTPAPTTEAVNTETPLDGAPAPKKAGRPKKTQKEKVPVSPVGRTLRKTRSQGPVEV